MIKGKIFKFSLFIFIFIISLFFTNQKTFASPMQNVYGEAWSQNIGWISFNNCNNPMGSNPDCSNGNVPYGVEINSQNELSGYAWSSNIGWVKFGGLSSFPTDGVPNSWRTGAYFDPDTNTVVGFAKAINGSNDGWDGWILFGNPDSTEPIAFGPDTPPLTDPDLEVMKATGTHMGWGSYVVGWVDFSNMKIATGGAADLQISASPSSITFSNNTTTLTWQSPTSTNFNNCEAFSCSGSSPCTATVDGSNDWDGLFGTTSSGDTIQVPNNGNGFGPFTKLVDVPLTNSTTTFTISCIEVPSMATQTASTTVSYVPLNPSWYLYSPTTCVSSADEWYEIVYNVFDVGYCETSWGYNFTPPVTGGHPQQADNILIPYNLNSSSASIDCVDLEDPSIIYHQEISAPVIDLLCNDQPLDLCPNDEGIQGPDDLPCPSSTSNKKAKWIEI
ncbi:MAG: hypothetical protein WDK96_01150 [Candidatus Paceibacterota bacterium]